MVGSYEWIILLLGFVCLLAWELVRTRRAIAAAKKAEPNDRTPAQPP